MVPPAANCVHAEFPAFVSGIEMIPLGAGRMVQDGDAGRLRGRVASFPATAANVTDIADVLIVAASKIACGPDLPRTGLKSG